MVRAQGGRVCRDVQPLAQIGIVRDDICVDHVLTGREHRFRDADATGNALRLACESMHGFGGQFLDRFGQFPTLETTRQGGNLSAVIGFGVMAKSVPIVSGGWRTP